MTPTEYNKLNELLSEYSRLSAALDAAEAQIKTVQLAAAQELLPEHAKLKVRLTEVETALHSLSDANYLDLFGTDERRNHNTPFGGLKYTKSTAIETDDEEKSLLSVKVACVEEEQRAKLAGEPPQFVLAQLVRVKEALNLETFERFDDATLARFGLRREHRENFRVVPFDMRSDKVAKAGKARKPAKETVQ